ncbi:hypothetical protein BN946_scf184900.g3 [Trametes cinnabarina]|uniref:Uncharacterized protein n=1 Tax=Pycnoporus cinnabarinus TaxID=5643 RepID=A0A060SVL4_PYCCI|nr:hypothetical protein BN946_scf184900.g3 [Trametes cinnabarina]
MDTLKRVFSHRSAKDTGARPVPTKRYCRYPACGEPFYTTDKIKEFCSPECLQDFNWRPPSYCFPDVPDCDRSLFAWRPRQKNPSRSFATQQYAIAAKYIPIPSAHRDTGRSTGHGRACAPAMVETHGPPGCATRAARLASKPLPKAPVQEVDAMSTGHRKERQGYTTSRDSGSRRNQDRHRPAPLRPPADSTVAHTSQSRTPPHAKRHAQQPSLDPAVVQHFGGVDDGGWPIGVPVYMDSGAARGQRRGPPPTPPPLGPLPPTPMSAIPQASGPLLRRAPRPRSNSFGGFNFPATARFA